MGTSEAVAKATPVRGVRQGGGKRKEAYFQCPMEDCAKVFNRSYNFKAHMRLHNGTRPYHCPLEGCGERFKWHSSLINHLRRHDKEQTGTKQQPRRSQERKELTTPATKPKKIDIMMSVSAKSSTSLESSVLTNPTSQHEGLCADGGINSLSCTLTNPEEDEGFYTEVRAISLGSTNHLSDPPSYEEYVVDDNVLFMCPIVRTA